MTALSVPILGERVPLRRWLTIAVGLAGVLVMLRPTAAGFASLAVAAAAAAAGSYALSAVLVRKLASTNSSAAMVLWFLIMVGAGSGLLAGRDWRGVASGDWPWLGVIGASGALGQYGITEAFRRAPPAIVAPFEYSALLWALGIDWIFWSVLPSAIVLTGATIVVACGLFIIWDERRIATLAQTAAASPPP
jgi:drug/metabolite transporter (DMT)-like permease